MLDTPSLPAGRSLDEWPRVFRSPERLAALHATGLLDSPPEEAFDRVTRLAGRSLGVPVALVSFLDAERQFFKSQIGLPEGLAQLREIPLAESPCRFVVMTGRALVVGDAREDAVLGDNPLVRAGAVVAYAGVPLATGEGEVLGTVCAIDRRPRAWTEEELGVLQDLAAVVMGELELRRSRRHEQERRRAVERMKDELIALVSHELRTPLTALRASLGLLSGGQVGGEAENGRRLLELAARNTERLQHLVDEILEVERLHSGALRLEMGPVAADELLYSVASRVRATAEREGIAVQVAAVEAPLRGDSLRLQQVLVRLLSNAIRFSPRGATVWLRAAAEGDELRITIRDQGPGIPAAQREAIFGRFQQVDASDTRVPGGFGLGLTIVRGIVERHGGRIWVEGEPGEGSSFVVSLPRAG